MRRPNSTSGMVSMSKTKTAIVETRYLSVSPHQYRNGDRQARLVGQGDVTFTDAKPLAQLLTTFGPNDAGPAEFIRGDADIANPQTMREAGAHGLDDRLLGGEAHCEET